MFRVSDHTPAEPLRWTPRATACDEDAYGVLRAPVVAPQGLLAYKARDDFSGTTAGGTLNGRTAPVGGAWATSGAAADFVFADPTGSIDSETVTRSDSTAAFRYGVLGPSTTTMRVAAQVNGGGIAPPDRAPGILAVLARWVDANNHLRFTATPSSSSTQLDLVKVVGGVATTLATTLAGHGMPNTLELSVDAAGDVTATFTGAAGTYTLTATDTDLAAGGTLASGKGGIADAGNGATSSSRYYGSFEVTDLPLRPAVIYANQSAELRTDGMYRASINGDSSGPVASVIGDLPRLPPSGAEGRPVELFVKPSNGDRDQLPDSATTEFTVQVFYRPSWLTIPGT